MRDALGRAGDALWRRAANPLLALVLAGAAFLWTLVGEGTIQLSPGATQVLDWQQARD